MERKPTKGEILTAFCAIPLILSPVGRKDFELEREDLEPVNLSRLVLGCKFADVAGEPKPPEYYQQLYKDPTVGLENYWNTVTWGRLTISGTQVFTARVTLPRGVEAYLLPNVAGPDLDALRSDCLAAAQEFSPIELWRFSGIDLIFNSRFGNCICSWGGASYVIDERTGAVRSIGMTWMSPSMSSHAVFAHEIGHGLGSNNGNLGSVRSLPHVLEADGGQYSNHWTPLSSVFPSPFGCLPDEEFGCIAQGLIGQELESLDLLAGSEVLRVARESEIITSLEWIENAPSETTPSLIEISIGDNLNLRYFIDARTSDLTKAEFDSLSFDTNMPERVVIHLGKANGEIQLVIALAQGETFWDSENGIMIQFVGLDENGKPIVSVLNGSVEYVFLPLVSR